MMRSLIAAAACLVMATEIGAQTTELPILGTWRASASEGVMEMTIRQNGDTVQVDRGVLDSTGKAISAVSVTYISGGEWVAPDNSIRTTMRVSMGGRFIELTVRPVVPRPDIPSVTQEMWVLAGSELKRTVSEVRGGRVANARSELWRRIPKP